MTISATTQNTKHKTQIRQTSAYALITGLFILPFVVYIAIANHYFINAPYLDDFSVVLDPINMALSTNDLGIQIRALFLPNAGHLPVITRLTALLQIKYFGSIDFKESLFFANAGWILTTLTLIFYFRRSLALSWLALLPIPFLMLNINHWEAMDFITPAWQMYWGSALLPVLLFIALVEQRITLAVYAFTAAIFLSSGALPLYPIAIAYCLFKKRWNDSASFALRAAIPLLLFFYFNPPSSSTNKPLNIALMFKYIPAFMGNLVSTGKWDMSNIAWLHITMGLIVIASGLWVLLRAKNADVSKLIFIYVLMLGGMAAYLRGDGFSYVVSRYALFASLTITALYAACITNQQSMITTRKWGVPAIVVISMMLWLQSIYLCRVPLQINRDGRIDGIKAILDPNSTSGNAAALFGDQTYLNKVIGQSKLLNVYNLNSALQQ